MPKNQLSVLPLFVNSLVLAQNQPSKLPLFVNSLVLAKKSAVCVAEFREFSRSCPKISCPERHTAARKSRLKVEKNFFICYNNSVAEQKGYLDKSNEITGDFCGGKKWTNIWN